MQNGSAMESNDSVSFTVSPVGIVRQSATKGVKEIHILDEFEPGLEGIEEHLHLMILYWLHEAEEKRGITQFRPHLRSTVPRGVGMALHVHGIFSSRAPFRPNPIGVSVVALVDQEGNVIKVRGLDAIDGTPVLDIKPYFLA